MKTSWVSSIIHLLDELQGLLEKQIALAQQGDIGEAEVLIEQAGSLTERISDTGILKLPEFKNRKELLQKLYETLCLSVSAKKAGVGGELSQIRRGRRTIETYRDNM